MKAILEFNLPEEQDDYEIYLNAKRYYSVLWDLDQLLRNKIKYADDDTPERTVQALEYLRHELHLLLEGQKIEL